LPPGIDNNTYLQGINGMSDLHRLPARAILIENALPFVLLPYPERWPSAAPPNPPNVS